MTTAPETSPRSRLRRLGVSDRQCEYLLSRYPLEMVRRQLEWLPFRNPQNPAQLITAAIKNDYAKPSVLAADSDDGDNSGDFLGNRS